MGYLDKATITVDAILTNRGRELLAEGGRAGLEIVKFAIADDEIDYGLYNVNHPEGSEYYGAIIENMPVLEATPDEQQIMRYKLVTLNSTDFSDAFIQDNGQIIIPSIQNFENVSLSTNNVKRSFTPGTNPVPPAGGGLPAGEAYTLLIGNANLFKVYTGDGSDATASPLNTSAAINANGSITLNFGTPEQPSTQFTFVRIEGKTGSTTATLFGQRTGATKSITITVS